MNMTLVQASIANNGESVIVIADRLLTQEFGEEFPSYEFEGNTPKIISRGNVGIGFAGSALYADMAISAIPSSLTDSDKIVEDISKFVKDQRDNILDREVLRITGIQPQKFFSSSGNFPEDVCNYIFSYRSKFRFEFECIIAGFDKNEDAMIYYITEDGEIISATNFGVGSIGSGSLFSQIYFDQCNYDDCMSEIDGLFFAFKAKKWAEAPTGVGAKTDILLLRKNGEKILIKNDDALMSKLTDTYQKEKIKTSKIKDSLLKQLIENSRGALK